jgi:adenine-specific DNA methylase
LPDPGTPEKRKELCEMIGGKVVKKIERKKMPNGQIVEREKEITEGGILHWGRETENKDLLDWFRQEIKKAYGGRAPKVLDPFAGGGAIPLEAMRLGCEATAIDINPVAWFILKCTLEYPQKLAGKTWSLPEFILRNETFMRNFFTKAKGYSKTETAKALERLGRKLKEGEQGTLDFKVADKGSIEADLAWHVRAWGQWVLERARKELAQYYPVYADFEALDLKNFRPYEKQPMRLVPLKDDGTPDIHAFNKEFNNDYLVDKRSPRWIDKPAVAYLWARTVKCKNCRAIMPLLKTRWLCKKDKKRVLLTMEANREKTGVVFGIEKDVPLKGSNTAQRREYDKKIGAGTMSRSGAKCPCCGVIMTMEDIRLEGQAGRLNALMTAVVLEGQNGKEYRLPLNHEIEKVIEAEDVLPSLFAQIPFGLPEEPLPGKEALGFRVPLYGYNRWKALFTPRQLLVIGTLVRLINSIDFSGYDHDWAEATNSYLACILNKVADYNSAFVAWQPNGAKGSNTFQRWALPMKWDFSENNILDSDSGGWISIADWVSAPLGGSLTEAALHAPPAEVLKISATSLLCGREDIDVIITDPPYYDAISYSDLMDFFYVWLRRILFEKSAEHREVFKNPLSPKWDHDSNEGELIDDASRHDGDKVKSKAIYEDGMYRVFVRCYKTLKNDGHLVIVFAHKQPDAWETLVSAIIRAGFTVDGSWPIQTEMGNRTRSQSSAALASSVWLVCKKRPINARHGWDNQVLEEMRENIRERLREFWDAGIRGPDFVWAGTGPALEAYSKHPVVKKANDPGQVMTVSEFLTHVRRIVVDFVVGRMLSGDGAEAPEETSVDRLDEPTCYYLLHRHDFGLDDAPAGACILYAISCGISDRELASTWDLINFTKGKSDDESGEEEGELEAGDSDLPDEAPEESGSKVKLKTWAQRKSRSLGYEAPGGKPIPLIDRVHCLMHLWKGGDLHKVDEYLDENGLRRQELFRRLLQSIIELSAHGSEERSLLESLSNHIQARGAVKDKPASLPGFES